MWWCYTLVCKYDYYYRYITDNAHYLCCYFFIFAEEAMNNLWSLIVLVIIPFKRVNLASISWTALLCLSNLNLCDRSTSALLRLYRFDRLDTSILGRGCCCIMSSLRLWVFLVDKKLPFIDSGLTSSSYSSRLRPSVSAKMTDLDFFISVFTSALSKWWHDDDDRSFV